MDVNTLKNEFIDELKNVHREGMEKVISWLIDKTDFFTAPASTRFHGAYQGGLLMHSLNVYRVFKEINDKLNGLTPAIPKDSIVIAALLHDICKVNTYKVVKRWRKDKENRWEQYDTYEFSEDEPLGHGEKSVMLLQRLGLQLTESEVYLIRWHMGGFDESKMALNSAMTIHPEIALMHMADLIATYMLETKDNSEESL